jgi:hypothetical protein
MKNFPRPLILMLALNLVCLTGCKMSGSSSSTSSNRNDKTTNSTNATSATSATTSAAPSNSVSPAPNIAGKYNVIGTNPNGSGYRGTLEVFARGDVYQFRWNAGTQYDGVAIQNGNIAAVAFANGPDGKGCGVIDYDIQGDGTLNGKWGYWGVNEAGKETATRTAGGGLEGEYDAAGKNPDGREYKAKLTVEPAGNLYRFVWSNNTDGIGIKRGNNIAVGIGGQRCGFVTYQVESDGTLDGIWGGGGSDKTGTEKATKQ